MSTLLGDAREAVRLSPVVVERRSVRDRRRRVLARCALKVLHDIPTARPCIVLHGTARPIQPGSGSPYPAMGNGRVQRPFN